MKLEAIDVVVPTVGESIATVFIARWRRAVGEWIEKGEPLFDIDSDKASLEVPSPVAGRVVELLAEEGAEVPVGSVAARMVEEAAPAASAKAPDSSPDKGPQTGPAARQAATEHGVDLQGVTGTGPRGRVSSRDVVAAIPVAAPSPRAPSPSPPPVDRMEAREERVAMSPLRRTIARRLVEAQHTAAMLTTMNEIDMSGVMALRKRYQEPFVKKYGVKLGFMSFFVKAAIEALKAYPAVNAEIDDTDPERPAVVYKNYYNVGVAVSTPRGLVVPVLRDADLLSYAQTEQAIGEIAGRARDGKLTLTDFQGGTFTITNGGVFGSLLSTPILNRPQVGILGMHSIVERPVGVDGQIVLRPMMYVAMSYDHRIIDGREAVSFLVRVKELVEAPERILLEV